MFSNVEEFGRALIELDELIESCGDLELLIARAAELFGCGVAVRTPEGREYVAGVSRSPIRTRMLPDGTEVRLGSALGAWDFETGRLSPDQDAAATVLRRIGIGVRIVVGDRERVERGRTSDLRTIVAADTADEDRLPALRRLGLRRDSSAMLIALAGPPEGVEDVLGQIRANTSPVWHTLDGRVHMVLAGDRVAVRKLTFPVGVRCAFAPPCAVLLAPRAWRAARNALRFSLPSRHECGPYPMSEAVWVDSAEVGGYAVLAEHLSADALAVIPDVQHMDRLYREYGEDMLDTLLAVASTDSLRKAARTVHMHHNSVAHRIERAERVLGFGCTEPYGRARLLLILTLHRLLESHRCF